MFKDNWTNILTMKALRHDLKHDLSRGPSYGLGHDLRHDTGHDHGHDLSQDHSNDLRHAIEPHPQGFTIRFEVTPGSSRLQVPSGFNPWRRSLEAKLTEEPTKGRANQQLVEEVARILHLPEGSVEVLSGHKNHRKVVLVRGGSVDEALSLLKI